MSNPCNHSNFIGRLTREPKILKEGKETKDMVVRFTLAADRRFVKEGGPSADFPDFIAYGQNAKYISSYCHKGDQVSLCAEFRTGSYKKGDETIYTKDFEVESIKNLERKKDGNENPSSAPSGSDEPWNQSVPTEEEVSAALADEKMPWE